MFKMVNGSCYIGKDLEVGIYRLLEKEQGRTDLRRPMVHTMMLYQKGRISKLVHHAKGLLEMIIAKKMSVGCDRF